MSLDQAPLPKYLTDETGNKDFWMWFGSNVWNGGAKKPVGFDIEKELTRPNQTLAMAVSLDGELHVFADGKDVGTPWQNLPVDIPMYGVVGLANNDPINGGKFQIGEQIRLPYHVTGGAKGAIQPPPPPKAPARISVF